MGYVYKKTCKIIEFTNQHLEYVIRYNNQTRKKNVNSIIIKKYISYK